CTFYVCAGYTHKGKEVCVRNEVKEDWAVREVITELREGLLLPERLEWLAAHLEEKAREQRSDKAMARLQKTVAQLETQMAKCRGRRVEGRRGMVGEVEAELRQTREALDAARKALRNAETADPARDLKITAEAARAALWRLESALEGGNRCLLKEALRGILAGVVIGADPYPTTTGKTRHRPCIEGIRLRPGSGLDSLSMLSS